MLTFDQITQYRQQGFCVCHGFLRAADIAEFLAEVDAILGRATLESHDASRMEMEPDQAPDGKQARRIYEPCTYYQPFRQLSESQQLLDAVEQLIGPNLTFHYSKINMKPAAIGSVVEWHQDLAYYPLTNRDSLAVLFYLDDADSTNGCLCVIPGVHDRPCLDHTRGGYFQGRITEPVDESKAVSLEAKAGAAIFMHAMTPHASAPNTSAKPRRTLILSYRAADAFPIYLGEMTAGTESHVRRVRGAQLNVARFSMTAFPIPIYPRKTKSLYELQELSRAAEAPRS